MDKIERILEKEGFQRDSVYFDICFKKNDIMVCIDYDIDGVFGTPYKIIKDDYLNDILKDWSGLQEGL